MDYTDGSIGNSNIIIYTTEDGLSKIGTTFDGDTVWLSIDQMAELFRILQQFKTKGNFCRNYCKNMNFCVY